jgi:hypothetical protein
MAAATTCARCWRPSRAIGAAWSRVPATALMPDIAGGRGDFLVAAITAAGRGPPEIAWKAFVTA